MSITVHPDVAPLHHRVRELRRALREAVDDWYRLSTEVRPRLHARYHQLFGDLERELQQRALAAADITRRVELLSIKHERGERLTPEIIDLINQVVDKEYARFTMRLREAFSMDEHQREAAAKQQQKTTSDHELVSMYRTLVKQLHPDVADAQRVGEDEGIWHQVQHAYAQKDASQLQSLLAVLGAEEAFAHETDEWSMDRWQQEVVTLEQRLALEERKLARLRREEPFTMEADIDDASWCDRRRKELIAAIAEKKSQMNAGKRRYEELTGGLAAPGENPLKSKEERSFEEDFLKNTYFGQR